MDIQKLKVISISIWVIAAALFIALLVAYPFLVSLAPTAADIDAHVVIATLTPSATPTDTPPTASPPPTLGLPPTPTSPFENAPTPIPSPTVWRGLVPLNLRIPGITLDAPIVPISWSDVTIDNVPQAMWNVPSWRAAGWHETSARLMMPGNTVLNGHNTTRGEVFRDLHKLEPGGEILLDTEADRTLTYIIAEKLILPEAGQPLEVRIKNASYAQPTEDERLTLVTCHPYGSLANRLIIIAYPQK